MNLETFLGDTSATMYGCFISDSRERSHLFSKLTQHEILAIASLDQLIHELTNISLFEEKKYLHLKDIQNYKKGQLETLLPYLQTLPPEITLVFSGSSMKSHQSFFNSLKERIRILDLSQEKPWDRKKRLSKWALELFIEKKLKITPNDLDSFLERCDFDLVLIQSEIEKLSCYAGEGKTIGKEDLDEVSYQSPHLKNWQLSESLIWGMPPYEPTPIDQNEFYPILGQLRYHLHVGLKLSNIPEMRQAEQFPKLRPKNLLAYRSKIQALPNNYFEEGLKTLANIEHLSKSSPLKHEALWGLLTLKLCALKNE